MICVSGSIILPLFLISLDRAIMHILYAIYIKKFVGYSRRDCMSGILIMLSFDNTAEMILHNNSHILFQHHCVSSCNRIVKWFVTVGLQSVLL